jgi:hypothetical protein
MDPGQADAIYRTCMTFEQLDGVGALMQLTTVALPEQSRGA